MAAAEQAADREEPVPVSSTSHLKDLAAAAAGLFGWNTDKTQRDTYNTMVISQDLIDRIRAAAAADASEIRQAPQLEEAPQPFPPPGPPATHDVKVTP
jgi:hypothetical protein